MRKGNHQSALRPSSQQSWAEPNLQSAQLLRPPFELLARIHFSLATGPATALHYFVYSTRTNPTIAPLTQDFKGKTLEQSNQTRVPLVHMDLQWQEVIKQDGRAAVSAYETQPQVAQKSVVLFFLLLSSLNRKGSPAQFYFELLSPQGLVIFGEG